MEQRCGASTEGGHLAAACSAPRCKGSPSHCPTRNEAPCIVFDTLFGTNSAPILLIDPQDDGAVVDANRKALEFYGYSREQFRQLHVWDINTLGRAVLPVMREISSWTGGHYPQRFRHRLANLIELRKSLAQALIGDGATLHHLADDRLRLLHRQGQHRAYVRALHAIGGIGAEQALVHTHVARGGFSTLVPAVCGDERTEADGRQNRSDNRK